VPHQTTFALSFVMRSVGLPAAAIEEGLGLSSMAAS
jgi:hypothetical protein